MLHSEETMDNLFSLMCFGALILLALFAFASMSGMGRRRTGAPYGSVGNEVPQYDDPFVRSGGSFGGSPAGGGIFSGGAPSASRGATLGEDRPRHNDSNVRSGGSFGG
jgi:hypothetical protein